MSPVEPSTAVNLLTSIVACVTGVITFKTARLLREKARLELQATEVPLLKKT
jgi:hypothetical protein